MSPTPAQPPETESSTATAPAGSPAAGANEAHPAGLYTLFGAEAWERFSYYGMRALLTLYLVNHLKFSRQDALAVYGTYTALVYLTPIIGGYFADKFLGHRKAVLIGGALMALGHLTMAFEPLLYQALGLLIIGNGFFKPNISTIVGGLYREGDPRRDGGFTIFYMGINLGAYLAPLVCGNLGQHIGWHYGFSAAAFGMVFGLGVFVWGQKWIRAIGMPPQRGAAAAVSALPTASVATAAEPQQLRLGTPDYVSVGVWVAVIAVLTVALASAHGSLGALWAATPGVVKAAIAIGLTTLVLGQLFRKADSGETQRLLVILVLCVFNIFFWMGFEQAGGTMTLFADSKTDRFIGWPELIVIAVVQLLAAFNIYRNTRDERGGSGLWLALTGFFALGGVVTLLWGGSVLAQGEAIEVAASQFQSINPILIVALAPVFSRMWLKLDQGRFRTSTPTKMAIGMIILGLGFVVMYFGAESAEQHGKVGAGWLAAVYALHTMGELCLSPIGLSMVTKLAPLRVESLAMGLWFVSSAFANYLAGALESILESYHVPIYGFLVASSVGPALLLLAITPILKRWMHGR